MTKSEKLQLARNTSRITASGLIDATFDEFIELHGDRYYGDDMAVITGIGSLGGLAVTVIGQEKGIELDEKIKRNFAMAHPEGYRKIIRQIKMAEKFNRPIVCIIDTAGAYPGIGSEQRGQASAIAQCLYEFSDLSVPVISIILSEGGSGGALAIGVCDYMYAFENSYYSVISPEGYAEILYKGTKDVNDVLDELPIFSDDLLKLNIIDEIIKEPVGGICVPVDIKFAVSFRKNLFARLLTLNEMGSKKLVKARYNRYRKFGDL